MDDSNKTSAITCNYWFFYLQVYHLMRNRPEFSLLGSSRTNYGAKYCSARKTLTRGTHRPTIARISSRRDHRWQVIRHSIGVASFAFLIFKAHRLIMARINQKHRRPQVIVQRRLAGEAKTHWHRWSRRTSRSGITAQKMRGAASTLDKPSSWIPRASAGVRGEPCGMFSAAKWCYARSISILKLRYRFCDR